jgi:hypothetical protein
LFFGNLHSQNTFPTAANTAVGIGTGTGAVSGAGGLRLKVTSGTAGVSGIQLTNVTSTTATTAGNSKALSVDASGNIILTPVVNTAPANLNIYNSDGTLSVNRTVTMNAKNLTFNPSTASSQFFINGTSGNVGIGTVTPVAKLDVKGGLSNGTVFATLDEKYDKSIALNVGSLAGTSTKYRNIRFFDFPQSNFDAKSNVWFGIEDRNDFGRYRLAAETGGTTQMVVLDKTQTEVMKVFDDGNNKTTFTLPKADSYIGIGTTNFVDGLDTYRLAVKGAIRADRVRVYTTWADYVFEKNYNLPTLEEVEKHIQTNGHLKDIPSAKEVDEKGIELGEMNKLLLQKIEELTLYVIELNKELDKVKNQIKN